jgi:hypothetical protein
MRDCSGSGNIQDNVIEGSFTVIDEAKKANERIQDWRGIQLTGPAQEALARAGMAVRFDDKDAPPPITVNQALVARRAEDNGNDLWSTFNRLQENLVKGGNRYRNATGRNLSTRPVKGIDSDTSLNRALWRLADEMRVLVTA